MRSYPKLILISSVVLSIGCAPQNYTTGYSGALPKKAAPSSQYAAAQRNPSSQPSGIPISTQPCDARVPEGMSLHEEDIRACMDKNNGALQAIYQRTLRTNPTAKGSMVVTIRISEAGEVTNLELDPNTPLPKDLTTKIIEQIRAIRFPASSGVWEDKYTLNFYPS